jgi:hypothetical protein
VIEGSRSRAGSGSGYIPLTDGSGSGSRRPKNMWIRFRNTGFENHFKMHTLSISSVLMIICIFNTPYIVIIISHWKKFCVFPLLCTLESCWKNCGWKNKCVRYIENNAKTFFNFCPYNNDDCILIGLITVEISEHCESVNISCGSGSADPQSWIQCCGSETKVSDPVTDPDPVRS